MNGADTVDFKSESVGATPIELLVSRSGSMRSQAKSLMGYVRSLDYTFRGVTNYASSDISRVSIEKPWFGKMEKIKDSVNWTAITDKNFVVVYDLTTKSITENMYIADAIATGAQAKKRSADEEFMGVQPVWIQELIQPQMGKSLKNITADAISIVTEYAEAESGYSLVYRGGKQGLVVLDPQGKAITVDDIQDDETFILVKLLTLLLGKGQHLGVFLIDAHGFSDRILSAFITTARLFYGNTFMFMYNVDSKSKVKRVQCELPNFAYRK